MDVLILPIRVWPEILCWQPVIWETSALELYFMPLSSEGGHSWRLGSEWDSSSKENRCTDVKKGWAVSRGHQLFHYPKKSLIRRVAYQIETGYGIDQRRFTSGSEMEILHWCLFLQLSVWSRLCALGEKCKDTALLPNSFITTKCAARSGTT